MSPDIVRPVMLKQVTQYRLSSLLFSSDTEIRNARVFSIGPSPGYPRGNLGGATAAKNRTGYPCTVLGVIDAFESNDTLTDDEERDKSEQHETTA